MVLLALGSVPPPLPHWRTFLYRLYVCNFHTGTSSHVLSITSSSIFLIDPRGRSGFFHFSKLFLTIFFFVLQWWSNHLELENFVENLLHLAIDQHPVCPNTDRRELWPRKWFLLGRVDDAKHVDRCRCLAWSHQLTSDLKRCLLFWKCFIHRVWKQFRCLRLS